VADRPQKRPPVARDAKGRILPGTGALNPGGKPKSLREIQRMLDAEHRTVENMREVYAKLRELAVEGVEEPKFYLGGVCGYVRRYDSGFLELYLNRVEGPVREIKADLSDAPPEVVEWLAEHLN
jgi:hypothetical protein